MSTQETVSDLQFEHSVQEIIGRINDMASRGEQGFTGYFVSGCQLHEAQDRAIAEHFGFDTEMPRAHAVIHGSLSNIMLQRTVAYSPGDRDQSQDSPLQIGVMYNIHIPEIY